MSQQQLPEIPAHFDIDQLIDYEEDSSVDHFEGGIIDLGEDLIEENHPPKLLPSPFITANNTGSSNISVDNSSSVEFIIDKEISNKSRKNKQKRNSKS